MQAGETKGGRIIHTVIADARALREGPRKIGASSTVHSVEFASKAKTVRETGFSLTAAGLAVRAW